MRLGIASCLLGDRVRYDGGHKRDAFLADVFGRWVEWVPVCPEMEIGLGVPRPPIRLERRGGEVRLMMPSTGADLTAKMRRYAARRVAKLAAAALDGYVLKSKSPSCGMERVRVHAGPRVAGREGRGVFAEVLLERLPHLPVEEETGLEDRRRRESFIVRAFAQRRWRQAEAAGWTRARLIEFHERHELLLMSRHQAAARRLRRLLEEAGRPRGARQLAARYRDGFTAVLSRRPTYRGHAGVLRRLASPIAERLDAGDRRELAAAIEDYRRGHVPLTVPLTLLRHQLRHLGVEDLAGQVYLEPHPCERRLLDQVWGLPRR